MNLTPDQIVGIATLIFLAAFGACLRALLIELTGGGRR